MKRKVCTIWLAALLLILAGCGGGNSASGGAAADSMAASSAPAAEWDGGEYWDMGNIEAAYEPDMPMGEAQGGSIYQNPGAKLIRRAEFNIQTEQFDQSVQALNQLVANCGG